MRCSESNPSHLDSSPVIIMTEGRIKNDYTARIIYISISLPISFQPLKKLKKLLFW
jgi:hypothetical protein